MQMKLTYSDYLNDPALRGRILAEARRERSRALERLIFAPIAALFRQRRRMQGCSGQVSLQASASSSRAAALG
jgi:hypothetical protein